MAVIGSGPAGITCAGELAKLGYDVHVLKWAATNLGGVLVYGIPEFRLPKVDVVAKEIQNVIDLGVTIDTMWLWEGLSPLTNSLEEEGFQCVCGFALGFLSLWGSWRRWKRRVFCQ